MSAWIGPLGSLFEFKCPSAVESSTEDPHVYFRPLGGDVGVTRLGDGTRPRVWDVSVSAARPGDVATLQSIAEGSWGIGPWAFIPPGAEALNLLGKRQALCLTDPGSSYGSQQGTPVQTTEGPSGSSYVAASLAPPELRIGTAPVIPGQQVTARAWVQAPLEVAGRVRIVFYTAGHVDLGATPATTTTVTTGEFLSVTVTVPATAAYAQLRVIGAVITRPSITWTSEPRAWAPSKASQNVVISPLSDSVRRATGAPGEEQITDHRFTVTELRA